MKKPVIGILIGSAVLFLWGAISWMVLPFHNQTIKKLPEEQLISDTLKTVVEEPGLYFFPGHDNGNEVDRAAWAEKYKRGPVGVISFSPTGKTPMDAKNFIFEIVSDVVIAAIGMLLLLLTRDRVKSLFPRALLVALLGVIAAISGHAMYWNWMHFPGGFIFVNAADTVFSFFLLGFALAKFTPEA